MTVERAQLIRQGDPASCWWFGCPEAATTFVTCSEVTRCYCPKHAEHVERYYAAAARWEAKTEHSHA